MNAWLLASNLLFGLSTVTVLSLGIMVLVRSARRGVHIAFSLLALAVGAFELSYITLINASSASVAYQAGSFAMIQILIGCLTISWALAALGKTSRRTGTIATFYSCGVALIGFLLLNLDMYTQVPVAKLYFNFYPVAGPLYALPTIFFSIAILYSLGEIVASYRKATAEERNRQRYYFFAIGFGAVTAVSAIPLVYGFKVNPILAGLTGFYIVPIAYGIVRHELMDIKVVARRALFYAVATALAALALIGINLADQFVARSFPSFPHWLIPVFSSAFAVLAGTLVWRGMRDTDILKYEFIAVVTHKFRTPLTYIKWSMDEFVKAESEAERKRIRERVSNSVATLSELTGMLIDVARNEATSFHYAFEEHDVADAVREVIASHSDKAHGKDVTVSAFYADRLPHALVDLTRIKFVFQILYENAINYSQRGGAVQISVKQDDGHIVVSVADHGIGIAKEDFSHLFAKFFRGAAARVADTEGMGIGLYMARTIVERHHGKIWAVSEGAGKGSTFSFSLPVAPRDH